MVGDDLATFTVCTQKLPDVQTMIIKWYFGQSIEWQNREQFNIM